MTNQSARWSIEDWAVAQISVVVVVLLLDCIEVVKMLESIEWRAS
jgi:hypothetical protein